jgi:hypothetical protein
MPVTETPTWLAHCPQCKRGVQTLLVNGRAFCDRHGWVWADWQGTNEEPEYDCWQCEDGEALRVGQVCLTCGIQRLEA